MAKTAIAEYDPNYAVTRDEGVYDTQTIASGVPQDTEFFSDGIQGRSYADTNVETPNVVPGDRELSVMGVKLYAVSAGTDDPTSANALSDVEQFKRAILELDINQNTALRIRVSDAGVPVLNGNSGSVATSFFQVGAAAPMGYRVTSPNRFIPIMPNTTFKVTIRWNENVIALNSDIEVVVYLVGPQAFRAGRA